MPEYEKQSNNFLTMYIKKYYATELHLKDIKFITPLIDVFGIKIECNYLIFVTP